MIHLDRNHHHPSPLSPHSNSNLILQQDHLKILSTSQALPRDEPKSDQPSFSANDLFDFNIQEVGVHESVLSQVVVDPDAAAHDDLQEPIAVPESDHTDLHAQEQLTSPKPDGSSSLSPPPTDDAVASPIPIETVQEPFLATTEETAQATAEDSGDGKTEEPVVKTELDVEREEIDSPLSELEPAPEQEAAQQNGDEALDAGGSVSVETVKGEEEGNVEEVSMKPSEPMVVPTEPPNTLTLPSATKLNSSSPQRTSIERDSSMPASAKSPSISNAPEKETWSTSRQPSVSRFASSTPAPPSTDKGVRLLELNAELLK